MNIHKQNEIQQNQSPSIIQSPHIIYNEESKKYIDEETGEEVDRPPTEPKIVPLKAESDSEESADARKMFFQKLLKGGSTSVISGQIESIRKAQSMDNLNLDDDNNGSGDDENRLGERPRSASPTLSLRVQGSASEVSEVISESSADNIRIETDNPEASSASEEIRSEPDSIDSPLKVPLAKRLSSDSKLTNYAKDNLEISLAENDVDSNQSEHGGSTVPESPASSEKSKCRPFLDIPEFTWSPAHQKLLTELLFSIEKDTQVWKT